MTRQNGSEVLVCRNFHVQFFGNCREVFFDGVALGGKVCGGSVGVCVGGVCWWVGVCVRGCVGGCVGFLYLFILHAPLLCAILHALVVSYTVTYVHLIILNFLDASLSSYLLDLYS